MHEGVRPEAEGVSTIAIYGRDFYGRSKYGGSLRLQMIVDPFEAEVIGFDGVSITWSEPGGDWSGFRLVKNNTGFPVSETDGRVLLEFPVGYSGDTGGAFIDLNLVGGWHYYAIFLWDDGAQVWERAAVTEALVPFDFGSTEKLWNTIPDYYKQVFNDTANFNQGKYQINPAIYLNNENAVPNQVLAQFLHILGWGMDLLRTQIELTRDGYDIEAIHANRLALLAAQFGGQVEEAAPANVNRSLVRNLGWLYRRRGTLEGIREMLALTTGWEVDVTIGPNLMLSEDQANFVNPEPQWWDPTVRYEAGDRVRNQLYLYQAKTTAYGYDQAPPPTKTDNTWWESTRYVEPEDILLANDSGLIARDDTGDVSTWQVEGPTGFISGMTKIGAGTIDPEDGTIHYSNSLLIMNDTDAMGDFIVRSIPRRKTDLTSWDTRLVVESGIPVPRARKQWQAGRYRAGDVVMFEGAPYEAKGTTDQPPTDTNAWDKLGHDDRIRLTMSWFAHGAFSGTPGSGGHTHHPVITEFDENGVMLNDVVCTPDTYADLFYDPFNDQGTLTSGRVPAKGAAWGTGGVGTWTIDRDDSGGYVQPPAAGRAYQLAPATLADAHVALTFRAVPSSGRLLGIVFRWQDASNFWIATQTGVYKVVAGTRSGTAAIAYSAFADGQRMQVTMDGNDITVYRDGVLLGSVTDSFLATANRHGVVVEAA